MNVKYTAIVTGTELIIRQAIRAGIDGPIFDGPVPADLEAVDLKLSGQGFMRTEAWRVSNGYAGLTLEAELTTVRS